MILKPDHEFPSPRRYVLKLRNDAGPVRARLLGRLENMVTGRRFDFANGDELLAWLVEDMEAGAHEAQGTP